jgi:hypothetical protein
MKINLRRYLLNIIGLLLFAAITIITIIIARGNRIDLNTGEVIETGTIRITAQPENIVAYINEQVKTLREKRVEGLDPGEYKLRIQHEGYTSWEGTVEVKPGFISDIAVTLFPLNQKLQKITQSNIDQITFDQNRSNALYVVKNSAKGTDLGIWKLPLQEDFINLNNNSGPRKISNFNSLTDFITKEEYHLILSSNGDKLLIANKSYSSIYLLDTNRYNEPSAENKLSLGLPVDNIRFLDNNSLVISSGNLLANYNIDTASSTLIYYHPQINPVFGVDSATIYWLNAEKDTLYSRTAGTSKKITLQNIKLPSEIGKINVSASGNIIAVEAKGATYLIDVSSSYIHEFTSYSVVSLSPNGQFLLVRKDDVIYSIETTTSQILNEIEHKIVPTTFKATQVIAESIIWSFDSSYFVFQGANGDIISSDSRAQNPVTLVTNEQNRINGQKYILTSNNKSLLVNLQDGLNESSRLNIYRLDFTAASN